MNTQPPKLSEPQIRLLVRISFGPKPVVDYYTPARKLVELGYAFWNKRQHLEITEAGKALVTK